MRNSFKNINRIISKVVVIIMFVTLFSDVSGITAVHAEEETAETVTTEALNGEEAGNFEDDLLAESKTTAEEPSAESITVPEENDENHKTSDITPVTSRVNYDVVHFIIQNSKGENIPELLEDVIEIDYDNSIVNSVISGFEFLESRASDVEFTLSIRTEYEGVYRLISVGDKSVEASGNCKINGANKDEQEIPVVVEACEYDVFAQVNISGEQYDLTDDKGKSIEEGRKVSYGEDFTFKLKNGSSFFNDFVKVSVAENSGEKVYQISPDRNNVYTIEGEKIRGNIEISQDISVGYGNVKYTGGFFRGNYKVEVSENDIYLVAVPEKPGDEAQTYNSLSVPEGSYKLELKEEFAKKYKLVEPDKIYKVIKNRTTEIDAAIELNDKLNQYKITVEGGLGIVNFSAADTPVYQEISDNKQNLLVYDVSDEITLNISIDDTFSDKYEIKSIKYKDTEENVENKTKTAYRVEKQNYDSVITEISVVVGTINAELEGEFGAAIAESSEKYLEIVSIKASEGAEPLVKNENEKYEITKGTDYISIDIKTLEDSIVPVENIGCRIDGAVFNQYITEYDYDNNTVHMAIDTASLIGRDIEFFVRVNTCIIFDDNVMKPEFSGDIINIVYADGEDYNKYASYLKNCGVEALGAGSYVYELKNPEKHSIGDFLSTRILVRDNDTFLEHCYTGENDITFYYQIFGDKPGGKHKIANPDNFNIVLDQANAVIVFSYEVKMTDRVFVDDNEVYDLVVNLDRGSQVKLLSTGMSSNLSALNSKDPSTASWKISSLSQDKSDELLEVVKNDAVYFTVDEAAIQALGYKQFAIERTENGKKTIWNFIINSEKPEITVKNLDNKTIYAGQEMSFAYEVNGSKPVLTKENVKIYKADGTPADEKNIQVKSISSDDITIAVSAVEAVADKETYYIDIVNLDNESLLKDGRKLKLNVAVLDSMFTTKNVEYICSDEDNIYFKVKGISSEVESLYTKLIVTAEAVSDKDESIDELYKEKSIVEETFKNDAVIKVPVKVTPTDARDDKSTTQKYSLTFALQQEKSDKSGVYKSSEVKLASYYSNRALYYEPNLKVKALPTAKNVYTGQRDIQIATPVFSKESSNTAIVYLKDDKGEIETNNYGGIAGNAYDPETGKLVINIPASVKPGKHVLTFESYAPEGYIASKASINIDVKIGIETVSMVKSVYTYYLGNKDINIKPVTHYYNITHAPMYESTIKPSTCKAIYRVESDNEYLLPYITVNPSTGNVKISKNLAKVYDRIKSMGTSFRLVATANDYQGTEVYKKGLDWLDREDKWQIEITTDGVSDDLKNNNEMRAFLEHSYYDEFGIRKISNTPVDVAIIDKNNKKRTQFTIQQANNLTFRAYRSASDTDDKLIHSNITWKVSGPVQSYVADNYGLHIHKVKPGIITVTAVAADGSGNGSISRTFEVKKDDYKFRLIDVAYGNIKIPTDDEESVEYPDGYPNENYAFQGAQFMILPYNAAETEMVIEEEVKDHIDDYEHNYKVKISGGTITELKSGVIQWMPTDNYTKITIINNNKGSDGKKVQEDKVYTIHNTCFDKTESAFDKVKVLPAKTAANKYYDGKKEGKIRFEVTNLPADVIDKGDGHTGYFLTIAKNYKEKSKFPNPEFDTMIAEVPGSAEIIFENGKYYVELHQDLGKEWWQSPSDFVAGTYKLEAFVGRGEITEENIQYVLNKKIIETTLTITPNNLKVVWEGGNTTKIKVDGSKKDLQIPLVASANSIERDTDFFKRSKNNKVAEVRLTDIKYDLDTLNIFKEANISGDKLLTVSADDGNISFIYTAEDFDALKNAVVSAAAGKTVLMGTSAQKAAAKMTAKPDRNGNYDMSKVKPVIRGTFTYEIIGTEDTGYEAISNLTRNFEITLVTP